MLQANSLDDALQTLGDVLHDSGATVAMAVVGGGALLLAGHIERPTKDVDIVAIVEGEELLTAEPLPTWLLDAIQDVARALELEDDWLNPGPTSVLQLGLPEGFLARCDQRSYGGMQLYIAGRRDQIALKLYAAADHWPSRTTSTFRTCGGWSPVQKSWPGPVGGSAPTTPAMASTPCSFSPY